MHFHPRRKWKDIEIFWRYKTFAEVRTSQYLLAAALSLSSLVVSSHTLVLLSPPTSSAHIIYLLHARCDQVALSDSPTPTSSSSPPPGAFAAPGIPDAPPPLPGGADEKSR